MLACRAAGRNERAISRKTWWGRLPLATSASGTPLIRASWNGRAALGICHEIGIFKVSSAFFWLISESNEPARLTTSLTRSASPSNSRNRPIKPRRVPQADQVELHDHQDHVGHLERREVRRLQSLAGIDHDRVERRPQQAEEPPAGVSGSIDGDLLHRARGEARRTARTHGAESIASSSVRSSRSKFWMHVGERMVRGDVQTGVDRSEQEVEIEQDGFLLLGGGQGGRQVDGQRSCSRLRRLRR